MFTQPPTSQSWKVCGWMLKAALVPQQLTLLLKEAACLVDGIFPPQLLVTQSRRGLETNAPTMCLFLLFCQQSGAQAKSSEMHRNPLSAPVSVFTVNDYAILHVCGITKKHKFKEHELVFVQDTC